MEAGWSILALPCIFFAVCRQDPQAARGSWWSSSGSVAGFTNLIGDDARGLASRRDLGRISTG